MAAVPSWRATLAVVPNNDGGMLARDGEGWLDSGRDWLAERQSAERAAEHLAARAPERTKA